MAYIRPAESRGHATFGWLNSYHSFSFGHYHDPRHMGWSVLRVINDDTVAPHAGFDPHSHRDMEIISYVLQGSIRHEDSMGNISVLRTGEVQRMSAGRGVLHSEYNTSDEPLKFLQIWIQPAQRQITPGYQQKPVATRGQLTALVTADGREDSLTINQDISLYRLTLNKQQSATLALDGLRRGYLHIIEGELQVVISNPTQDSRQTLTLSAGDAVGLEVGEQLQVTASSALHGLWFDLP
jgi:quercetin 2,3-dioxygenase